MELVIASNNKHKVEEITQILGNFFDKVHTLNALGIDTEIEETGQTFFDNALIKAKAISLMTGLPALSDDSGLVVDALGGAPGVHSARFAGNNADTAANNALLIEKMHGISNRKAKFVSVTLIYFPDGKVISAQGETSGEILFEPKGGGGFGYDPLFYSYELNKSFAECSAHDKNSVSHRARALGNLKSLLGS